ncbi:MAG: hypothetical protein ACFB00_04745 [Parvularculaceae bacterium]
MSTIATKRANPSEKIEYRLYLALAFPLCLAAAVARRLFGGRARGSAFAEAAETAHSVLPWAFMSRG